MREDLQITNQGFEMKKNYSILVRTFMLRGQTKKDS